MFIPKDTGPAARVPLKTDDQPHEGETRLDRVIWHRLKFVEGRWLCEHCDFTAEQDQYVTWRALVEDHRTKNGRR